MIFCVSSHCIPPPDFMLLILLMDQAENDLHITVTSIELVRRLTNKLFENNYAGNFVNKHTCIQGLSREGKSEEGIQTSCVTSSSLVPM